MSCVDVRCLVLMLDVMGCVVYFVYMTCLCGVVCVPNMLVWCSLCTCLCGVVCVHDMSVWCSHYYEALSKISKVGLHTIGSSSCSRSLVEHPLSLIERHSHHDPPTRPSWLPVYLPHAPSYPTCSQCPMSTSMLVVPAPLSPSF